MKGISTLLLSLLALFTGASASAYAGAPMAVIVDTDMALDDVRAIALLSSCDSIRLLAAVSSDGSCTPAVGAANLRRVLSRLGMADVPVGVGRALGVKAPAWRPMAESLGGWIAEADSAASRSPVTITAVELLRETLERHDGVVYLCLGPLTNLADLLAQDPSAATKLARVQYWGTHPDSVLASWNTERDPRSAERVFAAGLPISGVMLPDDRLLTYDRKLAVAVCALGSVQAELLCQIHASPEARNMVAIKHFRCWDETAVLDLLFPELFTSSKAARGRGLERSFDLDRGRQRYLDLLAGD